MDFATNRLGRSKKGSGNLIIAFCTCVLCSSPWRRSRFFFFFFEPLGEGGERPAQQPGAPAAWRHEKATLHRAPAQHVLDSTTSRFLSPVELNLDFLSTQQEGAAADIGDTSFQAADRQSAEVYAKEYEPLCPPPPPFPSPFFWWWSQNWFLTLILLFIYLIHFSPLLIFKNASVFPATLRGFEKCVDEGWGEGGARVGSRGKEKKKKRKLKSIS